MTAKTTKRATRKTHIRKDTSVLLAGVVWQLKGRMGSDEFAHSAACTLGILTIELCNAIRAIDGDRPEKARAALIHSLLDLVTLADDPRDRTKEEGELWQDIVAGRRNIRDFLEQDHSNL